MSISEAQRRHLKKLAHHLKPVVIVGNAGLTDNVIHEIDEALEHHELIKVRINAADKKEREGIIEEICNKTGADWVVSIGHVAGFYRQAEKVKVVLPKD